MSILERSCRTCGRSFSGGELFCPDDGIRLEDGPPEPGRAIDPLVGQVLDGRYRVLRVVGEGGMGIVYEAVHVRIERRVALKVLRDDFSRRPDVVERFRREAKSASRIGHPNIVDVLDFGETAEGASYFVMEMLAGQDVADLIARSGTLDADRAITIVAQCCAALAAAHDKGIIHRDLKPENIFLIDRGGSPDFVKILDFGVAKMSELESAAVLGSEAGTHRKLTRTGMIFGTPEYMSPEQAQGQSPDQRVDIYALGIILYELLTGRVPFEGASFMSVLSKHINDPVPRLGDANPRSRVSAALEATVYRALAKNPAERFGSMPEMLAALSAVPEMPAQLPRVSSVPAMQPLSALSGFEDPFDSAPTFELPRSEAVAPASAPPHRRRTSEEAAALRRSRWSRPLLAVGAGGGVLVALLVGLMAGSGSPESPPAAAAVREATSTASAPEPEPDAEPRTVTATHPPADGEHGGEGPAELDAERVSVRVTTQPVGASVHLAGGGELCAETPCSFDAVRGEEIAIQARLGVRRAYARVAPEEATDLHMVLDVPRAAAKHGAAPRRKAREATVPSDLKVPAAFRD